MKMFIHRFRYLPFAGLFLLAGFLGDYVAAAERNAPTEANVMVELPFTASRDHADPFNEVTLDVLVTDPNGNEFRVPAFWAGGKAWKVRYASPVVGMHRFRSECSDKQDQGLHALAGSIEVKPYDGKNNLYAHGPLRVSEDRRYLEHVDGTPFFWLGDTWWMGLCHRLHFPDEFKTLTADRKKKGFNVIQIVAGLYPDMAPFDPRGANEAGFPWETDYARIRPEYFDAADQRLQYLVEEGFTPCIVGAWGYFMPLMGVEKANQHWRYLIARYGALPVVWCAAGEANLPWYLVKGFPYDDRKQVTDWTEVLRYIRATDPYHRPLTIHPTGIGRLSARNATDDVSLLDIDMLQTPHGERSAVEPTVRTVRESYADKPVLPVINGEAAYEMLSDKLGSRWTSQMFWLCMMNGAAGHTYGANGIWQCNRREQPHGKSPHGGDYGHIPWDESMNLPGSTAMSIGKKLFEQYAWYDFQPHPEWAQYPIEVTAQQPAWGHWIWFPEGEPTKAAPVAKRYFRKTFDLPASEKRTLATLRLGVDDRFVAYLNGKRIASGNGWESSSPIDVTAALKSGHNVLAVEAENAPAPVAENPAGLLCILRIQTEQGKQVDVTSDSSWRCKKEMNDGDAVWVSPDFDDADWQLAKELGPYGSAPWGKFVTAPSHYGPYATGTPGKVRLIYVPESQSVEVLHLKPAAKYHAYTLNPVRGNKTDLGSVIADSEGRWIAKKPAGNFDAVDWVLVLEDMP